MMEKYHHKYRIPSARLPNWDYRRHAAYFITICTANREPYFGDIMAGDIGGDIGGNNGGDNVQTLHATSLRLSPIGVIADILWHEIKNHTTGVELGAFIVMPNHVHGILILTGDDVQTLHATSIGDCDDNVQTLHATSLHSAISPKPGSVSTIIRSYKSAVSRHAHRLGYSFGWQPRFYDHIIRDDASFRRISDYILNNPAKWAEDKFYNASHK